MARTDTRNQGCAGCACAGGPVYPLAEAASGDGLPFDAAYPGAQLLLKRLARWVSGGRRRDQVPVGPVITSRTAVK